MEVLFKFDSTHRDWPSSIEATMYYMYYIVCSPSFSLRCSQRRRIQRSVFLVTQISENGAHMARTHPFSCYVPGRKRKERSFSIDRPLFFLRFQWSIPVAAREVCPQCVRTVERGRARESAGKRKSRRTKECSTTCGSRRRFTARNDRLQSGAPTIGYHRLRDHSLCDHRLLQHIGCSTTAIYRAVRNRLLWPFYCTSCISYTLAARTRTRNSYHQTRSTKLYAASVHIRSIHGANISVLYAILYALPPFHPHLREVARLRVRP